MSVVRMLFVAAMFGTAAANAADTVKLYAAGSLRAALTEIGEAFAKTGNPRVDFEFGASGLLRERLAKGERADVFASANMEHPASLAAVGRASPVALFARNRLCALARADDRVTSANLLERMLDPSIKLGTSTPKADPSGDYAFELFDKAEALSPGARAKLSSKALKLTGGPDSPPPPKDRNVYAQIVSTRTADIFLTYCTNATLAQAEDRSLAIIAIPEALAVGANYGLVLLSDASPHGARLAMFVLSADGQRILAKHGFLPPLLP